MGTFLPGACISRYDIQSIDGYMSSTNMILRQDLYLSDGSDMVKHNVSKRLNTGIVVDRSLVWSRLQADRAHLIIARELKTITIRAKKNAGVLMFSDQLLSW